MANEGSASDGGKEGDTPSPLFNNGQVSEAVKVILEGAGRKKQQQGKKKRKGKESLFGSEEDDVLLQVALVKIPKGKQAIKFSVPHSIWKEGSDVCLIVKDLKKGLFEDHTPSVMHFQDLLASKGVKKVNQVMSLRQLRSEFKPYEAKRRLSNQFQVFLADGRIMCYLPPLLGKPFYDRKKLPVQVDLRKNDLRGEVERALHTTQLPLLNHGPCGTMQVGHLGLSAQQLLDNISTVLEDLPEKLPGGWKNVRSVYLKTRSANLSLPIYVSAVSPNDVMLEAQKKKAEYVEDELSTLPGRRVRVYPDGRIKVINEKRKPKKWTATTIKEKDPDKDKEEEKKGGAGRVPEEKSVNRDSDEEMEEAEEAYLRKWEGTVETQISESKAKAAKSADKAGGQNKKRSAGKADLKVKKKKKKV